MTRASQALGRWGEDLAAQWYVDRGYEILERNWRCKIGELDLIVTDYRQIVFCEVKTRTTDRFGSGFEAITPQKRRRIQRLALEYLKSDDYNNHMNRAAREARAVLRFDVASIVAGTIEVLVSAF